MIVARINGGLGNQLFQYATARAAAIRSDQPLILDTREYVTNPYRRFGLDRFRIDATICSTNSFDGVRLPPPRKQVLSFVYWQLTTGRRLRYYRERGLTFQPQVNELRGPAYLHGYFQSERYFADAADTLRRELSIKAPPTEENARWLEDIGATQSVGVHVRRGDYVTNASASQTHGTCSPEYYLNGARRIIERTGISPTFFVFSDDPDWTQASIRLPGETRFVRHNDDEHNYEDLRLLTACKHHIIANSSFSWWGAWLAHQAGQIVIAPRSWFRDPQSHDDDIVPATWERM